MFQLTYLLINFIVYIYSSEKNSIYFYLVLGVVFLILNIKHIKKIKQKAGAILFEVTPDIFAKWVEIFFLFAVLSVFLVILGYIEIPQPQLPTISILLYEVIFSLYLIFFTEKSFNENGVLINDKFLKWDKIESYEWHEKRFQIQGNQCRLHIRYDTVFLVRELDVNIDYSQRTEIESLLIQMVSTTGSVNDMTGINTTREDKKA